MNISNAGENISSMSWDGGTLVRVARNYLPYNICCVRMYDMYYFYILLYYQ